MEFSNLRVYQPDGTFKTGGLSISGDRIASAEVSADAVDMGGLYAVPGLVDLHFHGCMGHDFCDGTHEAISTLAKYQAQIGVAAICPATMTYPEDKLTQIAEAAAAYQAESNDAALVGINMEGPFISEAKKGAQNGAYLHAPDAAMFRRVQEKAGGLFKLCDLAPELPGSMETIDELAGEVRISIAHTTADYDTACEAFKHGARQVTHLYNAMPPVWASFARLMFSTKRAFSCSESCPPFMAADATAPMAPIMPIWPFSSRSSALDIRRPNMLVSLSWTPKMWSRCCRAMWA